MVPVILKHTDTNKAKKVQYYSVFVELSTYNNRNFWEFNLYLQYQTNI